MTTSGERAPSLVGQRLERVRSARKLSAAELAARVPAGSITKTVITNVESGRKRDLTVTELVQIAAALDISPLFLIVDTTKPWEPLGVDGVEATNIEYARKADLFSIAFSDGPRSVELALARGEGALEDLAWVRALIADAAAYADTRDAERILSDPEWAIQEIVSRLSSQIDTARTWIDRDPERYDTPVVLERLRRLERALGELRAEHPDLEYQPHRIMQRRPAPPALRAKNAKAADSAE